MLDRGEADALVTLKLDRLSRSVQDFASLLAQAQRRGWQVVALDVGVDTSTPAGKMVANVMAAVSQWESEVIGERTAAAHRVRSDAGTRVGQSPILPIAVRERIAAEVSQGRSLRRIAQDLNGENVPTAKGGTWYASTIAHVARSVAREVELAGKRDAAVQL
jgi:DNA invertase Pin-like site-specific DNA recombinase